MVNAINLAPIGQQALRIGRAISPWVRIALAVSLIAIAVIKLVEYVRRHNAAHLPQRRIIPMNEVRGFIAGANVQPPSESYLQDVPLYKNVAQLISGHLALTDVASLARVNRIWYNAAQPVLLKRIRLHDDLCYGLETAFRERGERQITQRVYYDRPKDAFYIFNNFLGENPELFQIGTVTSEAREQPVLMQVGQNAQYVIKPHNVVFTGVENTTPELRAKAREFQALCTLI